MKPKKNKLLLISWIIGALYMAYSIYYWGTVAGSMVGFEALGAAIATQMVMPHLVCTGVALLFNILAWAMSNKTFALVGAILYAVALVLFPTYFFFVIIEMILSFVAFAKMRKAA